MIPHPPAQVRVQVQSPVARTVASVLAMAQPDGAIPDRLGGTIVNADSNFLYLLAGLAEQAHQDPSLWVPVERGLRWLSLRRWGQAEPLPDAFPDGLPLEGRGLPMGSPPTAAVGATAARFVALVAALPHPPADLLQAAQAAWAGLLTWNWVEGKGMRNAWQRNADGIWEPREVWYAADQADYDTGRKGALVLGLAPCPKVPWQRFSPGRLALDAQGAPMALSGPEEGAALAILAFDGPRSWRPGLRRRLHQVEQRSPGFILPLTARAYLGEATARRRLLAHLQRNPLPLDREAPDSPVYTPVAGFVLRLLAVPAAKRRKGVASSAPPRPPAGGA